MSTDKVAQLTAHVENLRTTLEACAHRLDSFADGLWPVEAGLARMCREALAQEVDVTPLEPYREEGWKAAIRSVVSTLQMYPHLGGDESVMAEVDRLRRQAAIAALEALPCEGAMRIGYICLGAVDPRCPRCRALAKAKGGRG